MPSDWKRAILGWILGIAMCVALLSAGYCAWMARHGRAWIDRFDGQPGGLVLVLWPGLGTVRGGAASAMLAWADRAGHLGQVAGLVAAFTLVWYWQEWRLHRRRLAARAAGHSGEGATIADNSSR